jgi:Ca-activated chloride channel homolog
MRFADAQMLLFLVLPAGIVAALLIGIWSRRRMLGTFGRPETLAAQISRPSPYLRAAKGIALVLGLTGLVLAAARPQYGGRIQMLKKRGIDVVVALDFSKSMLAEDIQPNRLERAKLELADFIGRLTGDRIGLVAFAGDTMRFPLTTDYSAATKFWKGLGPYDMPVGGTAIGKALTAATRMLTPESEEQPSDEVEAATRRAKVIVLLTDGEDHRGDPLRAAVEAADRGITIHVVGIGSDSPELIPRHLEDGTVMGYQKNADNEYVTTALTVENEEKLREIASSTQGRYFRAGSDLSGMAAVVQEIRKLKQTDIKDRQITVYEEVYRWFGLPAFALLLAAFLLPLRVPESRRRIR